MNVLPSPNELTLKRMIDSYRNPRLEEPAKDYLNTEHIEQLRNDSEIVLWCEYAELEKIRGGSLRRVGFATKQGYTYDSLVGIPDIPRCEIPTIGTTAWTTSLEGHNEHVVRNLVSQGNYVLLVGAEGSYVADKPPRPQSPISLANSASSVLNFSYHMVDELRREGHILDPNARFVFGESRGSMVGEGIDALASEFGQEILAADEVAPCFPKKIENIPEFMRAIEQAAREPLEIAKLIGSLTLSRLKHYPQTLDIRPSCIKDQIAIIGALVNGETGELAKRTSGTALKHITVFDKDSISMRAEWETIYTNSVNTRITPLPGSHMTIADLETLHYVLARNHFVQTCVNQGLPLTGENVFDPAHAVMEQRKRTKERSSIKQSLAGLAFQHTPEAA